MIQIYMSKAQGKAMSKTQKFSITLLKQTGNQNFVAKDRKAVNKIVFQHKEGLDGVIIKQGEADVTNRFPRFVELCK